MSEKEKVVAVVSGGMDSVTMLKMLVDDPTKDPIAINFSYGSKHNKQERAALVKICDMLGAVLYLYDLPIQVEKVLCRQKGLIGIEFEDLLASNLLLSGEDVPEGHYEEENMKSTVVPFRNGIMLSIAVGFAESHGATAVYYGNHTGDHAVYNDCRPEFVSAICTAAEIGTYAAIQIRSPFADITKAQIAKLGTEIGAPLDIAWTCYKGGDRPCLKCCTCVERCEAFYVNKLRDPQLTDQEWGYAVQYMKCACEEHNKKKYHAQS